MARLELEGIVQRYGGKTVVHPLDLTVEDGEFVVLVGPSGCGKSTLLRIAAGLVSPSEGRVLLDGEDVTEREPRERDVAMVFQNYALYPHMTVAKNLAFPLTIAGLPRGEIRRRVAETAELLGIEDLLTRRPRALSGGQMQRVALGRAMIRRPRLFLFDEPLSNLDAKLRGEMRAEIARLHRRLGVTTLYVTHDQAEAMTMGARICVMREGRLEQVGAPLEVFARPATTFVAGFLGSPPMNLLRGGVEGGRFRAGAVEVPAPAGLAGACTLGVRPHEIELGGERSFAILHVEHLGTQTLITLDLGGPSLLVAVDGQFAAREGERLAVSLRPERLHWFDAEGRRIETTAPAREG